MTVLATSLLLACLTMGSYARSLTASTLEDTIDSKDIFESHQNRSVSNRVFNGLLYPTFQLGGQTTAKHEFPWIVNLKKGTSMFCSGTLIKLDVVLTAAHCLVGLKAGEITVTAGVHDLKMMDGSEQHQRAKSFKIHEEYNDVGDRLLNDIAVIQLKNSFELTNAVRPIQNISTIPPMTSGVTVAGWGRQREGQSQSNVLMKLEILVVSSANCDGLLRDVDTQFCAGQSDTDSCIGDYGGPVMCNDKPDQLCGIVSFGNGCSRKSWAGVYQKVAPYDEWIKKNSSTGFSNTQIIIFGLAIVVLVLVAAGGALWIVYSRKYHGRQKVPLKNDTVPHEEDREIEMTDIY